MKTLVIPCMAVFLLCPLETGASGDKKEDEKAIRDAFNAQVALYLQTTQADLQPNINFPNVSVTLLSSNIEKTQSLVSPYKGMAEYVVEYDIPARQGLRESHPYIMRCSYFNGKWDIDPHGHARGRNIKDLKPNNEKVPVSPDI